MSRITRLVSGVALSVALVAPAPALAEDLTGANQIICAAVTVLICLESGECVEVPTDELAVPEFIEIDLQKKRLKTTEASGESRSTPITHLKREAGEIVLQGHEFGRAFSFVMSEETGRVSVALAVDGFTISVFGNCTPMASSR